MAFVSLIYPGASFIRSWVSEFTWPHHCTTPVDDTHSEQLEDFDVDSSTGFLPNRPPLDRLPSPFDLWELALASAPDALSLGEDQSPEAVVRRESSRRWRFQLQNVPLNLFYPCLPPVQQPLLF